MVEGKDTRERVFGISNSKFKYLISYYNGTPKFGDEDKAMRFGKYEAYDIFNELERKGYDDLTVDNLI